MDYYRGELSEGLGRQLPVEDAPYPSQATYVVYYPPISDWTDGYTWADVIAEGEGNGTIFRSSGGDPEVLKTIEGWIEDGYVTGADDKFAEAAEEPEEAEDDEDDKSA